MKSLGSSVIKVAAPVLGRRGFGEAQMILDWASVVGVDLAKDTLPLKLSFKNGNRVDGTLHLRVANGLAPILQHLGPQLIDRINTFFGYRAVARLAMQQGPLPKSDRPLVPAPPRPLTEAEEAHLATTLAGVAYGDLRDALSRLGRAILADDRGNAGLNGGQNHFKHLDVV